MELRGGTFFALSTITDNNLILQISDINLTILIHYFCDLIFPTHVFMSPNAFWDRDMEILKKCETLVACYLGVQCCMDSFERPILNMIDMFE